LFVACSTVVVVVVDSDCKKINVSGNDRCFGAGGDVRRQRPTTG
jgi:hypothetical protein